MATCSEPRAIVGVVDPGATPFPPGYVRAWKLTAEFWLDLACLGGVLLVIWNALYILANSPFFSPFTCAFFGVASGFSIVGGTGGMAVRREYESLARASGWAPVRQPVRQVGAVLAALLGYFIVLLFASVNL